MENLQNHGISNVNNIPFPSYIRVYVKNKEDIMVVQKICQQYYGDIPALYLVSDVCRDDLLVEIEGVAELG